MGRDAVIVGSFAGDLAFGGTNFMADSQEDAFVARLSWP
jgi:hypothetical protein